MLGLGAMNRLTATLRGLVLLAHAVVDQHEVLGTIPSTGKINKIK